MSGIFIQSTLSMYKLAKSLRCIFCMVWTVSVNLFSSFSVSYCFIILRKIYYFQRVKMENNSHPQIVFFPPLTIYLALLFLLPWGDKLSLFLWGLSFCLRFNATRKTICTCFFAKFDNVERSSDLQETLSPWCSLFKRFLPML